MPMVPIIDLSTFHSEDTEAKHEVVQKVKEACEQVGFFVVTGHGVDMEFVDEMWNECFEFWNRPPQNLVVQEITQSPFVWLDWTPTQGCAITVPKAQQQGWLLGPTPGRKGISWMPDTPKMKQLWFRYYLEMERLTRKMMKIFALALSLPPDFFLGEIFENHGSSLRIVHYPEVEAKYGDERAGEHTDWGCLTILKQDPRVPGLQIKSESGEWSDIPQVPNGFVINLGDLLPRWTNDKWKATPHRVVIPKTEGSNSRLTIPFFGLVNPDVMIECIPSCVNEGEAPKYEPIRASKFFKFHERFSVYSLQK